MAFTNNVMIVRHKLLADLVRLWKKDELTDKIDRLPIELSPRKSKPLGRCCIHKERAVWKYKCLPLLGLDMADEKDELTTLSEYARQALDRETCTKENILCVIDEACSSCVQINYEITNLCRGCVARSCYMNCPKDAIRFKKNGQAMIDHDTCVSCGICHKSCPYHAIVYIPVPCEEACPVKAISKDERGIEHIDESKCIYCGKCMNACPFGAIFEISQAFDVLQHIRKGENPFKEKIVVYGSSILQGASASRPGMAYPARLSRSSGYNFINLGLSGNGKMEKEVAEMLADIDADAFILDCIPNPSPKEITDRTVDFVMTLHQKHPDTPIIVIQTLIRETGNFNRKARENVKRQNEAIAEQVEVLRKKNVKNLYFIKEDQFLGTDHEGTVDGTHPNDLGFDRMLKKYKPAISKILKIKFKAE